MATASLTARIDQNAEKLPAVQPPTSAGDDTPLLHFGLRQLLFFVAALSALLAALTSLNGLAVLVVLLGVLVVTMHVLATSLGSRLRSRADRAQVFEAAERLPIESIASASDRYERLAALRSGPRSPWHSRGTTVLPWLHRLVVVAVASGGVIGAVYLVITIGYRTSPAGVIVGSLSVAVLSGWFAFLGGSFYGVFRHGFRDAVTEHSTNSPSAPTGRPTQSASSI
jgi:hypothetical protein